MLIAPVLLVMVWAYTRPRDHWMRQLFYDDDNDTKTSLTFLGFDPAEVESRQHRLGRFIFWLLLIVLCAACMNSFLLWLGVLHGS
ncbi:MAG: hypothetical protein GC162_11195 [Planctomycetes bacterium]|nr:hypothetical protein [Planctomycetota bacterium]